MLNVKRCLPKQTREEKNCKKPSRYSATWKAMIFVVVASRTAFISMTKKASWKREPQPVQSSEEANRPLRKSVCASTQSANFIHLSRAHSTAQRAVNGRVESGADRGNMCRFPFYRQTWALGIGLPPRPREHSVRLISIRKAKSDAHIRLVTQSAGKMLRAHQNSSSLRLLFKFDAKRFSLSD